MYITKKIRHFLKIPNYSQITRRKKTVNHIDEYVNDDSK